VVPLAANTRSGDNEEAEGLLMAENQSGKWSASPVKPGAESSPPTTKPPQVEIFKTFRVALDDPCSVVLPVVSVHT
jgi:hypothetical protein